MDKQTLIKNLNKDLANELSAIIQYITYAAKATGPYRPQLTQFFLTEVADEQLHAQFLANKIVALGGEPTTVAAPVPSASNNREMLEAVLAAEIQAGKDYTQRAEKVGCLLSRIWSVMKWAILKKQKGSCATGRCKKMTILA